MVAFAGVLLGSMVAQSQLIAAGDQGTADRFAFTGTYRFEAHPPMPTPGPLRAEVIIVTPDARIAAHLPPGAIPFRTGEQATAGDNPLAAAAPESTIVTSALPRRDADAGNGDFTRDNRSSLGALEAADEAPAMASPHHALPRRDLQSPARKTAALPQEPTTRGTDAKADRAQATPAPRAASVTPSAPRAEESAVPARVRRRAIERSAAAQRQQARPSARPAPKSNLLAPTPPWAERAFTSNR